jgi:hypothetical protein
MFFSYLLTFISTPHSRAAGGREGTQRGPAVPDAASLRGAAAQGGQARPLARVPGRVYPVQVKKKREKNEREQPTVDEKIMKEKMLSISCPFFSPSLTCTSSDTQAPCSNFSSLFSSPLPSSQRYRRLHDDRLSGGALARLRHAERALHEIRRGAGRIPGAIQSGDDRGRVYDRGKFSYRTYPFVCWFRELAKHQRAGKGAAAAERDFAALLFLLPDLLTPPPPPFLP